MGAKTDLAVVRGAQVMAVALVVAVAYTSTMGLLKQKKIDLNGLEQQQELRSTPRVTHPNGWPRKPKGTIAPKVKAESPSTQQQTKPKDNDPNDLESEQSQTASGCSTPPGGGPAVTSDFKPC
ncbi:hypothetical protein Syncc9902_0811 [Synechococcus sp. CC9902]|nr:hypothetical protein Syncc9902_0811 [Synechococcus sp. CC9902]